MTLKRSNRKGVKTRCPPKIGADWRPLAAVSETAWPPLEDLEPSGLQSRRASAPGYLEASEVLNPKMAQRYVTKSLGRWE